MKNVIIVIVIAFFAQATFIFANNVITLTGCSTSTLSVSSNIEITPCIETQTTVRSTSLYPAAFDPIIPAMHINTDFLVSLATLDVKLNFQNVFVYVNVNKSSVMSFMSNADIKGNNQTYSWSYYLNNVYFVVVSNLIKSDQGYYMLNINVEALNSQVEQWTRGSQYAVPVEFTVLYQDLAPLVTSYGNIPNIVFNR